MKKLIVLTLTAMLCTTAHADTPPDFNLLVDAIYRAEGGAKAKKPFGILSVRCNGYADCRQVALNTVRNNWKRWEAGTHGAAKHRSYMEFLSSRYAPLNAKNDPSGLNQNWLRNVSSIYNQLNRGSK